MGFTEPNNTWYLNTDGSLSNCTSSQSPNWGTITADTDNISHTYVKNLSSSGTFTTGTVYYEDTIAVDGASPTTSSAAEEARPNRIKLHFLPRIQLSI